MSKLNDQQVLNALLTAIHRQSDYFGCKVIHRNGPSDSVLHPGIMGAINYKSLVIIESSLAKAALPRTIKGPSNASKMSAELTGLGLNCLMLGGSLLGMAAGAGATVATAGTAAPATVALTFLGWTGVVTGAVQTVNSAGRVIESHLHPDSSSLAELDDEYWYQLATLIVDYTGVASSIASLPLAYRSVLKMLEQHGQLMSFEQLKILSPSRRKDAIAAAIKKATSTPAGKAAFAKAAADANLKAQIADRGTKSISKGGKAIEALQAASKAQILKEFLSITKQQIPMAHGFLVNLTDASDVGAASGSLNLISNYTIHLIVPDSK